MEIDENGDVNGEQTNRIRTIRHFGKSPLSHSLWPSNKFECIFAENISGHSGIILTGDKPYLVLLTANGELRTHRFYGQTAMKSFAPFNNVNCPNGLIYFDHNYELQIAIFPTYLNYDSYWPVRKVPLRCTPTSIVYHRESKVYCVSTYSEEQSNHYFRFNGEDKEFTEENKGER